MKVRVLASLLVAGLAAACTRAPADERFAGAGVELKLMIWGAPDEVDTVNHYVQVFRERFPGIDVKIQHAPDMGYSQKLFVRFQGGDPPDVFYLGYEDVPKVASSGWSLPLDDFMSRDERFDEKDYFEDVQKHFRFEGKRHGVVKDFATLVLYYNKDLFDKHDVPYPKSSWTWDDFLAAAKKLTKTRPDGSREYGFVLETWAGQLFPWVWQSGGRFVEGDPPRWVLGEEPWLEKNARGFQFLADLIWKHEVAPNPSVTRDQGTSDLFKTGRIAMCTYGRWKCMEFRHIRDFDWDVCELPSGPEGKKATTLFPVCYAIARETKHPEAAWELLKFLTGEETQIAVGESGHAIPSMKKIATSPHFFEAKALQGLGVSAEPNVTSIAFADPGPSLLTWPELRQRMINGLEALWNGTRRDAREVLVELQPTLSQVVAEEAKLRAAGKRD